MKPEETCTPECSCALARAPISCRCGFKRDARIVRVDCGSDDTTERVARALHAFEYGTWADTARADHNRWTWDGDSTDDETRDYWRRLARAVLSELRKGEKA